MKFTKPFMGVPNGRVYPEMFEAGEECPPELVEAAVELGAVESKRDTKAPKAAPENK
jgi:hypothetical protein